MWWCNELQKPDGSHLLRFLVAIWLDIAFSHSLLPCVQAISAEEGCTATAVLMWRDGQGDVCLQVCGAGRLGQQQHSMLPAAVNSTTACCTVAL